MSNIKEIRLFYDYEGSLLDNVHMLEIQFVTATDRILSNNYCLEEEEFDLKTIENYWEIVSTLAESCNCLLTGEINLQHKPYTQSDLEYYQEEIDMYNEKYGTEFKLKWGDNPVNKNNTKED